ncbi:MAG: MarR family transcriptional regulator [Chloroflexi bacterium]|nr:MarR family transcriptional regulator [Chloroflexota bacterium]
MIASGPGAEELARLEIEVLPRLMRLVVATASENSPEGFLSMTQFHVLKRLARGPWLGSELAQELRITPPTVSAAIDSLVRRGLVSRGEIPEDRRAVPLQLTPEGRRCLEAVQERMVLALAGILEQIAPEERLALQTALKALARVTASHPEPSLPLHDRL